MTIEQMRGSTAEFLTPKEAAEVIGCDPYAINVQAREDARKLGFPVCVMGTRVRIPRRAFLRWLEYGSPVEVMTAEDARLEFDRLRAMFMEDLEDRLQRGGAEA